MPPILGAVAMAAGFLLSALWRRRNVVHQARIVPMQEVRRSGFRHCGNDLSGHAQAFDSLVSGYVVRYEPEARRERFGAAAFPGTGQLSHGVDVASQTAPRHGASWS